MHKSYYTVKPCQNKLLQMKWDQRHYEAHQRKLREIYPVIDTRAPKTYMHMHLKLKKIRLEEEKLYMIERDNRILLEKMSHIMRTNGGVDNKNNYVAKSLNREQKQRELLRVARENQEIMQKIIEQKPQYCVKSWEDNWNQNLVYLDQISSYPNNWWTSDSDSKRQKRSSSLPTNQTKGNKSKNEAEKDDKSNKDKKTQSNSKKNKDNAKQSEESTVKKEHVNKDNKKENHDNTKGKEDNTKEKQDNTKRNEDNIKENEDNAKENEDNIKENEDNIKENKDNTKENEDNTKEYKENTKENEDSKKEEEDE